MIIYKSEKIDNIQNNKIKKINAKINNLEETDIQIIERIVKLEEKNIESTERIEALE